MNISKKIVAAILFFILALSSLCLVQKTYLYYRHEIEKEIQLKKRKVLWQDLNEAINNEFSQYRVQPHIIIEDLDTGWIFVYHEEEPVPAASLVKLPIMVCCFDQASRGKINLDDKIALRKDHKVGGSGKIQYAPEGTKFTIKKLIELMVAKSDNTATNILIELFGFDYLNNYFKKLGLKNTNIARVMMDMESRDKGIENYTTAEDMAYLLKEIYAGKLISKKVSSQCLEMLKQQKSKDRIPAKLPKGTVVAHKTGLEKTVCHDIGIVYTEKGNFLICVLTKHKNKNSWSSKKFISRISQMTYNYITKE